MPRATAAAWNIRPRSWRCGRVGVRYYPRCQGGMSYGGLSVGSAPVVGVLALQGDVAEHLRALAETGATPVRVRRPDELAAVDGLVIPGGESTTMWKLTTAFEVAEPLRKRLSGGMPAF